MTDHDPPDATPHDDPILTPGPSAVVAFTLAALVLMGNNIMVQGTQAIFGQLFSPSGQVEYFLTWAIGALVPALASAYLARRAIADRYAARWELVVARSALVLAVVAAGYSLLLLAGALIHQS